MKGINKNVPRIENQFSENLPYHPTSTPRGFKFYDPDILTAQQQQTLNEYKVNMVRENEQYLKNHPEIKAIVSLLLTEICKNHSNNASIEDIAALYFGMPKSYLKEEIKSYLIKKERLKDLQHGVQSRRKKIDQSASSSISSTHKPGTHVAQSWESIQPITEDFSDDSVIEESSSTSQIPIDIKSMETRSEILKYLTSVDEMTTECESLSLNDSSDLTRSERTQKRLKRSKYGRRARKKKLSKLSSVREYNSDNSFSDISMHIDSEKYKLLKLVYDNELVDSNKYVDGDKSLVDEDVNKEGVYTDLKKYYEIAGEYELNSELERTKALNELYSKINIAKLLRKKSMEGILSDSTLSEGELPKRKLSYENLSEEKLPGQKLQKDKLRKAKLPKGKLSKKKSLKKKLPVENLSEEKLPEDKKEEEGEVFDYSHCIC